MKNREQETGNGEPSPAVVGKRTGPVLTITLNRPEKLNAFDPMLGADLVPLLRSASDDHDVRVIVLTGAGRAFCAGGDISYLRDVVDRQDLEAGRAIVELGRTVVTLIREAPKPVIASVNGAAAGGGANLALACDLRIASDRASIGQVFNRIGLHPDWGGTFFLPRLVGTAKALELIFRAEMVPAAEATALGLFNRTVPHDDLERHTAALAGELAAKPPLALALAKQAIYASERHTLAEMLDLELRHQLACFRSGDAAEGLAAFLEKRAAAFAGR